MISKQPIAKYRSALNEIVLIRNKCLSDTALYKRCRLIESWFQVLIARIKT